MSTSTDDHVVRLARESGLLCEAQIAAAEFAVNRNRDAPGAAARLLDVLIAEGALTACDVARLLAQEFRLPIAELAGVQVPAEVLALVPGESAVRHQLLPLRREAGALHVAVSDPLAVEGIDDLARRVDARIDIAVAPADELARAISRCYGRPTADVERRGDPAAQPAARTSGVTPADDDAPIIRLVHSIIAGAVRRRASDIHWEPLEKRFRVRYRIDGVLFEADNPPKRLQLAIVSRIKIMANISIAEKRIPQDGRIAVVVDDRPLDLRVSTLPSTHGETVVMRILDQESLELGLAELGLHPDDQARFERLLALPDGMLLVTGPTGSGKTTTLYSCLQYLNRSDRKIITVEDPVEYQLTGINQVPVRPEAGVTFASALRAILRQAPNVVMIGEIRDLETAEIAINAALTGHLVFSTLHTNDAAGAVTRLIDIGVKPFLVSSALRGVLAQRLIRKTCESCRGPYAPAATALAGLPLDSTQLAAAAFRRGTGCPTCLGAGYRGRTGIFELMVADEELQQMIHAKVGTARLRERARARGMNTLRQDGVRKAIAGLTTVEEVVSITVADAS